MKITIPAGRRNGRTFDNQAEFINALDAGDQVFTVYNRVHFEVVREGGGIRFVALPEAPAL